MTTRVRVERDGVLLTIVLAAGERGNALDLQAAEELREASKAVGAAEVGCVLLRAEGNHFCVGGDLNAFAGEGEATAEYIKAVAETAHEAIVALAHAPVPVVSAVQGAAAGAGIGLALCADLVVAASTAKFRLAYTAIGLSPDCGGSWFLPQIVGYRRALDLALTNRVLTAEEALGWGVVSRVVAADDLESVAKALAVGVAGPAFAETKRLLRAAAGTGLEAHLDDEARTIVALSATPRASAAIQAFTVR